MNGRYKKLDFAQMVANAISADHRIGSDIVLLDDYMVGRMDDYEFTAVNNTFVEVLSGTGFVEVDSRRYEVRGHSLIAYLAGQRIKVSITGEDALQRSAVFSNDFVESLYQNALSFSDLRTSMLDNPVVHLDNEARLGLEMYVFVLKNISANPDNPNGLECARYVTLALFYGPLYGILSRKIETETMRTPTLSSRFISLLERNFRTEHRLRFYADSLNISERYLYVCVKSLTGKSPGYWVDYYLMTEARRLLKDMNLSIQQIAYRLGFAGMPSFTKFFSRHQGMNPSSYRKSVMKV